MKRRPGPAADWTRGLKRIAVLQLVLLIAGGCTAVEMAAEDRSFDDQKADTKIKAGIITDINNRMNTTLAALLNVDVYEQRVLLTGEVDSAEERAKVGEIVRARTDVKRIYNEVQVAGQDADEASVVDDVLIAEKLRLKLASTQGVSHTNWRFRSVNGRVYLFGRALTREEYDLVAALASDTADVRAVVNRAIVRGK